MQYTVMVPIWHAYTVEAANEDEALVIAMNRPVPDWIEGMEHVDTEINPDASKLLGI